MCVVFLLGFIVFRLAFFFCLLFYSPQKTRFLWGTHTHRHISNHLNYCQFECDGRECVFCSCAFHLHKLLLSKPNLLRVLHFHSKFLPVVSLFSSCRFRSAVGNFGVCCCRRGFCCCCWLLCLVCTFWHFILSAAPFDYVKTFLWTKITCQCLKSERAPNAIVRATGCCCCGCCLFDDKRNIIWVCRATKMPKTYRKSEIARTENLFWTAKVFYVADSFNFFYISSITLLSKQKRAS